MTITAAARTTTDVTAQTPSEIDAQWAEINGRAAAVRGRIEANIERIERNDQLIVGGRYMASQVDRMLTQTETLGQEVLALREQLAGIVAETLPHKAEWAARGGWTRAYLVDAHNGHVHRSTACGTCFSTTQFYWITDLSGASETEIVDQAGDSACTMCYPTAPVALDPTFRKASRIEEPARRQARIEREQAKAARAAKAAAAGINNPDGSELRSRWGALRTERAAQIELVDNIVNHRSYGYESRDADNARIVAALAHKRRQTLEQVTAVIEAKVAAKIKRDAR